MTAKFSLTMDAADPLALGEFWALALGYVREPPPAPHATWEETLTAWGLPTERWNDANAIVDPDGVGPRIFIQKVAEPKTAKNRLHIDVRVSSSAQQKDREGMRAKADQLVAAGATLVSVFDEEFTGHWIVMLDPEGNEFCVV
ncbi:MAG TPA: VOC family protein [Arachnia sp.]|nr:VOC family protein [Arachnia sp.]HMR14691.1 VOC family protein [Arachnia sp.]